MTTLTTAFAAWERPGRDRQERDHGLAKLLATAADVGVLLYQQPCGYEFAWAGAGEKRRPVPGQPEGEAERWRKLPALLKVTDEKGALLRTPVAVVQAVEADT